MCLDFDVIQSVYRNDCLEHLQISIKSIMQNTLLPVNYIIVIDGEINKAIEKYLNNLSTNNYGSKVNFKVIKLKNNIGLGQAMNIAAEASNSSYIARMDSDDYCCKDRFRAQLNYLEKNPDTAMLGMYYDQYDACLKTKIGERRVPRKCADIAKLVTSRNPINHPTIIMCRKAFLNVGGYPKDCYFFEDWMLVYKFLKAGYKICNIEMVGLKVRGGNDFYKRRKGYTYFQNELKFFKMLKNNHYIGYYVFSKNVLQRFLLRVVLYPFVNLIYKKVMR
ncbi:MAG: glycosyltransferase [Verrucomicrobiota bacterium]